MLKYQKAVFFDGIAGGVGGMDIIESPNDAGLNSLSGFSYQIKVFILKMTQLKENQQVEFETLDDVTTRSLSADNKVTDFCIKRYVAAESSGIEVFQVKQTDVTKSVARKVLYNWLLAYNENSDITSFHLYVDDQYSVGINLFCSNDVKKEYDIVIESNKSEQALITRVKRLYNGKIEEFKNAYQTICNNTHIDSINNIDRSISNQLVAPFHATAAGIGLTYFEKRIYELVTKICARIIDSAGRRIPYICGHAEYMQLCEEICRNISPTQYTPDYESFRQAFVQSDLTEEILQSRECRQLRYCNLTTPEISDHLSYEQYYENIRQHYLRDAQKEKILSTERIANQNHKDVVLELQADGRDKPSLRLVKTKLVGISTMPNEFSRWGAYIFLTKDKLPNQISWKDENGESDE